MDRTPCNCKLLGLGKTIGSAYLCKHYNFAVCYPSKINEWVPSLNYGNPEDYTPKSAKVITWKCSVALCDCHIWEARICDRTYGENGCPFCRGLKVCIHDSLLAKDPQLCEEWNYSLNKSGPETYTYSSGKKVWWRCSKSKCNCHVWEARIIDRTRDSTETHKKTGCPFCYGFRVCEHDNLLVREPHICKDWDYDKNVLRPENYSYASNEKVWWKCSVGKCNCHVYMCTISNRTLGRHGCPFCSNQQLCPHNNLAAKDHFLCLEWDYEKNLLGPENYAPSSVSKVHWVCSIDKSPKWFANISDRHSHRTGCPICKESKGEKCVRLVLDSLNIQYEREWAHRAMPNRRYDLSFLYTKMTMTLNG
jgi:hypothetical protein